jgi:hypothetical protein
MWPKGRYNHYWFDMNRDWLPVQLPESQARIRTYRKWMPNILCDFHEMGTNATYFFQPGEPSRTNPTPELNQVLTRKIAGYHAKALDEIGSSILLKRIMMTFITVKVLLILILTEQLGFCLSKLAQEGMRKKVPTEY